MRIFAIDDEFAALGLLECAVREVVPDGDITTFNSAVKMLDAAKQCPPDVVFMDIEMPGMTGLEMAKCLTEIKNDINIIFVTGYSEYALEAFRLYSSGYIIKPVSARDIEQAIKHLRHPVKTEKIVVIKTFGNFGVFANGQPVKFRAAKSRELLAYLVDREGTPVKRKEAAAVLYEDEDYSRRNQKELSRIVQWMVQDLKEAGIEDIFRNVKGEYSLNTALVSCDLFDFLAGNTALFHGEYMEQYTWGEYRKGCW